MYIDPITRTILMIKNMDFEIIEVEVGVLPEKLRAE